MGAADSLFQKAEQALKKRNFDYAIELYQQGLAIDPDRLEERRKLRATAIRRCQESGTSTTGGKMLKLKNAGLIGRIKKLGAQKKFEEAIIEAEKYLAIAPQDSRALMTHGSAFTACNRVESAMQAYKEVTEVDPTNALAWKSLGKLYEKNKEIDKAVTCWERVQGADPSDQEAGKAIRDLSAAKMMAEADERKKGGDGSFVDMLKSTEESAKLEKMQARIRTADDAKDAIQIKREAVEADAENPRGWRELGDLYLKTKNYAEAEGAYFKARELNPQDIYIQDRLGKLAEAKLATRLDQAKKAAASGEAGAKEALATVVKEINDFRLAEYERQVVAHPTDYSLKFRLAELLLNNDRIDEAIAQYQQARKDPKFATNAAYKIGLCFFKKGIFGPAISQLSEALESVPDKSNDLGKEISYELALAHFAQGGKEKALELLEGIMVMDINYRDVSSKVDEIRNS